MDASARQALLIVRVLKLSFILAGAMFIFLVIRIPAQPTAAPNSTVELAISVVALMCVIAGFYVPSRLPLLTPRSSPSLLNQSASAPVKRWFARCVVSLAFFDACNLLAVVLHFVGARVPIVELVFAIGMLSLIFWSPGTPPSGDESPVQQN